MKKIIFAALAFSAFQCDSILGASPDLNRLTDTERGSLQELSRDPRPGIIGQARRFLRQDDQGKLNRNELEQFLRDRMPVAPVEDEADSEISDFSEDEWSDNPDFFTEDANEDFKDTRQVIKMRSAEEIANEGEWLPEEYNCNRILLQIVHNSKPGVCTPAVWDLANKILVQLREENQLNYNDFSNFIQQVAPLSEALSDLHSQIPADRYMTEDEISQFDRDHGMALLRRAKRLFEMDKRAVNRQEEILRDVKRPRLK